MEIPDSIVSANAALNQATFGAERDKWIRPGFDLTGLRYLREKAGRERDSRELYRGRAPFELLQNADDVGARQAVFVLTKDGLCFAHDGTWFSAANFRSLADGWSDKDPNQCIGHKGLGFRSVLDLTPSPAVIKVDRNWFGFRFGCALNQGHINETLRLNPDLVEEFRSWSKNGQSVCPVMAIPSEIKKSALGSALAVFERAVRGDIGLGLTTMFWLPAADPDADKQVVKALDVKPLRSDRDGSDRLSRFVQEDVSTLLPFLKSLKTVSLFDHATLLAQASLAGDRSAQLGDEISVDVIAESRRLRTSYFQLSHLEVIPQLIKNDSETPRAVRQMAKAGVRLSIRLGQGAPLFDPEARFHVYFPTEETTGLGLTVHGDYYVKPDRTRLMPGRYNEWLMQVASRLCAGEFLNQLLDRYQQRDVFEALRPSMRGHDSADQFRMMVYALIKQRADPFILTTKGSRLPHQVALPGCLDEEGFWTGHYSEALTGVTGKDAFLDPSADSENCRHFLRAIGVQPLPVVQILDLTEASSAAQTPAWWASVYRYLANRDDFRSWGHQTLGGRRLLLTADDDVVQVPSEGGTIVCFAPTGDAAMLHVPNRFRSVFVFLNSSVIEVGEHATDPVRNWLMYSCRVARFEASEVVPRAIRNTAQSLYTEPLSYGELLGLWRFLERILTISRGDGSHEFWNEIRRLPVAITGTPLRFAPAFLTYWPEGHVRAGHALAGVQSVRRLLSEFLADLIGDTDVSQARWEFFLESAGVSGKPKTLTFVRIVGSGPEVPFATHLSVPSGAEFTGERQHDENIAVVAELVASAVWDTFVKSAGFRSEPRSLQQVSVVQMFEYCCARAAQEHDQGLTETSEARLWDLIHSLPHEWTSQPDQVFRRWGTGGGSSDGCGSYFRHQRNALRWLPSTLGPANSRECFLRLRDRRLISRGNSNEEIGDLLIPYVVANHLSDYAVLQGYGIEPLEEGATPGALSRFLDLLGRQFQDEAVRESWLVSRSRWRLLRGAIQESYRALNQAVTAFSIPQDLRLATNFDGILSFRPQPWFYADPGSPAERAFRSSLAFVDADRPYVRLFQQCGVTRLIAGESLAERLSGAANAVDAPSLKAALINDLGPYLLAVIIAKAEEQGHASLVRRRLHERFDVRVASEIAVTFTLQAHDAHEASFKCPHFYLKRDLIELPGAIRESHYTLYVVGTAQTALWNLDGDALGEALAPVYCEGSRDEYRSAFPRVVSRFLMCHGDADTMSRFLLEALNVSDSAMAEAREDANDFALAPPAPPPAKIVVGLQAAPATLDHALEQRSQVLGRQVNQLFVNLQQTTPADRAQRAPSNGQALPVTKVSSAQQDRGRRGELEFMRRTQLVGGWEGFVFEADRTKDNCGYDFDCRRGDESAFVEVKTFAHDGRIVVSPNELLSARMHGNTYYLVGFLDAGPEGNWESAVICDPFGRLLEKGSFGMDIVLEIKPNDLFDDPLKGPA